MYGRLVKRRGRAETEKEREEEDWRRTRAPSATEQLTNQDCSRETKEREKRRGSGRRERTAAAAVTARQATIILLALKSLGSFVIPSPAH